MKALSERNKDENVSKKDENKSNDSTLKMSRNDNKENLSRANVKIITQNDLSVKAIALVSFLSARGYVIPELESDRHGDSDHVRRLKQVVGDGSILAKLLAEFGVRIPRPPQNGRWLDIVRNAVGYHEKGDNDDRHLINICERVLWCGVTSWKARHVVVECVLGLDKDVQDTLAKIIKRVGVGWNGKDVEWTNNVGSDNNEGNIMRLKQLERELEGAGEVIGELKGENVRLKKIVRELKEREEKIRQEERDAGVDEGKMLRNEEVEGLMAQVRVERQKGIEMMRNINRLQVALEASKEREIGLEEKSKYEKAVLESRDKRVEELLQIAEQLETQRSHHEGALRDERALSLQYRERIQELEAVLGRVMTDQTQQRQHEQQQRQPSSSGASAVPARVPATILTVQDKESQNHGGSGPGTAGLSTHVPDELDLAADKYNVESVEYKPDSPPRDYDQSTSQDSSDENSSDDRIHGQGSTKNSLQPYSSDFSSLYSSKDGNMQQQQRQGEQQRHGDMQQVLKAESDDNQGIHGKIAGPLRLLVDQLDKLQDRLFHAQEALESSESERSELRANYSLLIKEIDNLQNQKDQLEQHEIELVEGKERLIDAISNALQDKEKEVCRLREELGKMTKLKSNCTKERNSCREDALRMEKLVDQIAREKDNQIIRLETQLSASKELAKQLSACMSTNAELRDALDKTRNSYIQQILQNMRQEESGQEMKQSSSDPRDSNKKMNNEEDEGLQQKDEEVVDSSEIVVDTKRKEGFMSRRFSRNRTDTAMSTASARSSRGVQMREKTARCSVFWKIFKRDSHSRDEVCTSPLPRYSIGRRHGSRHSQS